MESPSAPKSISFAGLHDRLLAFLEARIRNGEFTERGFARVLHISQPQVHNILKRARKLKPEVADLILSKLNISLLDLVTEAELTTALNIRASVCHSCPFRSDNSLGGHVPVVRLANSLSATQTSGQ